jgi:hypothetical protein
MTKLRTSLKATALVASLLSSFLASSASFAQGTPEQRAACTGDAFRYCSAEIPNVSRITACMRDNFSKLSPNCKAVFLKG